MHPKNLQKSITEIYKAANRLYLETINEVFQLQTQNHHNLGNNSTFRIPSFNTIFEGKESVPYVAQKIWSQIPDEMKSLESFRSLKEVIKKWAQ